MIKTVIFDIDNTLYDFSHANKRALKALGEYTREHFGWDEESFFQRNSDMMADMHRRMGDVSNYHNRLIRFQNMLEEDHLPLYPHVLRMYNLYWDTLIDTADLYPGVHETLQELKDRNLTLGIGTDMTAWIQFQKLDRMHLMHYFDFLVSSEEACIEKPGKALFDRCLEKAECRADECLFIGDSLTRDYKGAVGAGMQALWFVPPGGPLLGDDTDEEGIARISSLKEVLSYI